MAKKTIKNIENYKAVDVLALAIEVYNFQGFIRSGEGYTQVNQETGEVTGKKEDNKTLVLGRINDNIMPQAESLQKAQTIMDKFNGRFMLKKLQGGISNFEKSVSDAFSGTNITNFHVSVISSIPHMNEVDKKRQTVRDKIEAVRFDSDFFGTQRQRYDLHVEVIDVKFVQTTGVYMITSIHNNKDIIKFWWRDQPDLSDLLDGKTVHIRGTVNKHEDSKYSNAKETMLNRVKVLSAT